MVTISIFAFLIIFFLLFWILVMHMKLKKEKGKVKMDEVNLKKERKEKILELLEEKEKVANDDVQNLLGISDASATRYLDELEKEERISQVGKTGQAVYYELK